MPRDLQLNFDRLVLDGQRAALAVAGIVTGLWASLALAVDGFLVGLRARLLPWPAPTVGGPVGWALRAIGWAVWALGQVLRPAEALAGRHRRVAVAVDAALARARFARDSR